MSELSKIHDDWNQLLEPGSGMPTAPLFYDRLQQTLGLARREPLNAVLMLLSWETGSVVNDEVALEWLVGSRIASSMRSTDTVARFTPGHLAVMLPNANDEDVPFVTSRLLLRLMEPFQLDSDAVLIRPACGVAVAGSGSFVPEPQELVRQAHSALAEAIRKGGGFAAYESPESKQLLDSIQTAG